MSAESGDTPPDIGIVLFGARNCGKSSAVNVLLGKPEFEAGKTTAECIKRQKEIDGKQIVLVDTPGWQAGSSEQETAKMIKHEMVRSVLQCQPGPHVLLLVMDVSVAARKRVVRSTEEHVELLGEEVWKHTMVLFTKGDLLRSKTIEQHIEMEGDALQKLLEKCGNRYFVFRKEKGDGTQASELVKKIEEMVAGSTRCLIKVDNSIIEDIEKQRMLAEEGAKVQMEQRQTMMKNLSKIRALEGAMGQLSKVRLILLGQRLAGKSSTGNSILGSGVVGFSRRSVKCVRRLCLLGEREVSVVDTPGWSCSLIHDASELEKQEVMHSVSMCPPRPHAFLIVVSLGSPFGEKDRSAVEEYMGLLQEKVWEHAVVLFSNGDLLGSRSIEQHIHLEGEPLQWLIGRCENRYHVFNNQPWAGCSQVTELLDIIEGMAVQNKDCPYEIESVLEEVAERRRQTEKRAKERLRAVTVERDVFRSIYAGADPLSELRIVVLGEEAAGKSQSINTILGRKDAECEEANGKCVKKDGEVSGTQVTIVEVPGWARDQKEGMSDASECEIMLSGSFCPPGPHVLLVVVRLGSSFKENSRKSVVEHLKVFGENPWRQVIVLFTCGDWLGDTDVEQYIESEGDALQGLIEMSGNRYHVFDNKSPVDGTQVTNLMEKMESVAIANNRKHLVSQRLEEKSTEMSIRDESNVGNLTQVYHDKWAENKNSIKEMERKNKDKTKEPKPKKCHSMEFVTPSLSGDSGYGSECSKGLGSHFTAEDDEEHTLVEKCERAASDEGIGEEESIVE